TGGAKSGTDQPCRNGGPCRHAAGSGGAFSCTARPWWRGLLSFWRLRRFLAGQRAGRGGPRPATEQNRRRSAAVALRAGVAGTKFEGTAGSGGTTARPLCGQPFAGRPGAPAGGGPVHFASAERTVGGAATRAGKLAGSEGAGGCPHPAR